MEATKAVGGYVLHVGRLRSGAIRVGETVTATVGEPRVATEKNHTTTHLANWALREVLGDGVQQKGSLVDPDKLRFDFSHGKSLSDEELERVESLVGQSIEKKMPVYAEEAAQELALQINGLRAVFGEKYPPTGARRQRRRAGGRPVGRSDQRAGGGSTPSSSAAARTWATAVTRPAFAIVGRGVGQQGHPPTGRRDGSGRVQAAKVSAAREVDNAIEKALGRDSSDDRLPPLVPMAVGGQMIADGGHAAARQAAGPRRPRSSSRLGRSSSRSSPKRSTGTSTPSPPRPSCWPPPPAWAAASSSSARSPGRPTTASAPPSIRSRASRPATA